MNAKEIQEKLIEHGKALYSTSSPAHLIEFTKVQDANSLLSDLQAFPHAFVLGCVMDRQIPSERAWLIPYQIKQRAGGFSMEILKRLSLEDVRQHMSLPTPLHRFTERMSKAFHSAVERIANSYSGDARRIWEGRPSSAEVVYRFLEFHGVGPKIATMAANILAREFKVPFSDYYSVDISADIHVRRVFARLGFLGPRADSSGKKIKPEEVIYKARAIHPQFPGILDFSCWEIGKKWCKPKKPDCNACSINSLCPSKIS